MNNKIVRRTAGAVAIASVSAVAMASMGTGAASAQRLPGGFITQTLVDGTKITVSLKDESVRYARKVVASPTTRNVWLSGKVLVTATGSKPSVSITPSYVVGCQVTFDAGVTAGVQGNGAPDPQGGTVITPDNEGGNNAGGSFTLGPGQARTVPMIDYTETNDYGIDSTVNSTGFDGNRGGVAYSEVQFGIDGCAGYASAKAKIEVSVSTDAVDGYVTLFGKPFTLGG
ncbi:MspA family porin [Williamsia sp. CHRR-6]|uniref:MspA family porin n=1 Tax=Williamsia sp. CHRR-6 TaxID=2835871 RepID=UPI001BDAB5D2|nr:MspA family porin [Williamsia sp. CHRR-6]MBT0566597.1 MspA family porin [Williamsia sp. CHRR-6]